MTSLVTHSGITSFTDVKGFVEAEAVARGWVLTGGWLEKGESSVSLTVSSGSGYEQLELSQRTPTGTVNVRKSYIRVSTFSGISASIDIHVGDTPDTVWLTMKCNTDVYMHMGFGYLTKFSIWKGGCWIFGSQNYETTHLGDIPGLNSACYSGGGATTPAALGDNHNSTSSQCCAPFWETLDKIGVSGTSRRKSLNFIHCELRGRLWEFDGYGENNTTDAIKCPSLIGPMYSIVTNTFNSQTILHPYILGLLNASNQIVPIGMPEHIRFVQLANYNSGDIMTVGAENWKLYPLCKRDAVNPQGLSANSLANAGICSTGLLGIAVRTP